MTTAFFHYTNILLFIYSVLRTACQDLLTKAGAHSGCLRGKTIFHKWGDSVDEKTNKGFAQKITSVISCELNAEAKKTKLIHVQNEFRLLPNLL